jgi:uracil-DNA glycosylase
MHFDYLWEHFEKQLFPLHSKNNGSHPQFNFYKDANREICLESGPKIRCQNLFQYLASFTTKPDVLVLGEAPGWRGCRFSGVPFTSEALIINAELPFQGQTSSNSTRPHAEASASIFWRVMRSYHPNFFVWNCIPLHPYQAGRPLSNRKPTLSEIRTYLGFLEGLIDDISPEVYIAVGISAKSTAKILNLNAFSVRHPSHGGASLFEQQMQTIFSSILD